MPRPALRAVVGVVIAFVVVVVAVLAGLSWLRSRSLTPPLPGQQRCVATANGSTVTVDLEQARYAAIIAGLAVRRGLPERAVAIALATAYQESGIRNLGYGDRDSLGLFQQRPSQGWGTKQQIMDPHYSTRKFYDALVKVDNWRTRDITEVAQAVQRSGYPDAYRDHEADSLVLAAALTGSEAAAFSCLERDGKRGDPAGLADDLQSTVGARSAEVGDSTVQLNAATKARAWAYAHFAVANARRYGVAAVRVGDREWRSDGVKLPEWGPAADTTPPVELDATEVLITLR